MVPLLRELVLGRSVIIEWLAKSLNRTADRLWHHTA
ncbi:MAG TPA: hypothetical protein ENI00_06265 [Marinobacter antarcticus]|uniref:Uncharacterized protein n=1 Tax=Marinobacter antarcticus TaxID=564117 RepID=A0A831R4I2_9GAMM|nr:hypothetical protein [Marinobacter antarcticus]